VEAGLVCRREVSKVNIGVVLLGVIGSPSVASGISAHARFPTHLPRWARLLIR